MKNQTAFPVPLSQGQKLTEERVYNGMELRDYFAAKALQGSLSSNERISSIAMLAKWCYQMADAMMEARENDE